MLDRGPEKWTCPDTVKPLLLISPWFGPWPVWFNFFVESCKRNPEVEWLIPTDQPCPENTAENVRYQVSSFEDYKRRAGTLLGVDLRAMTPYKLCDLRPCLGVIHQEDLEAYSAFGYCDIDVIFGDIRAVYTDDLLSKFDAISAADDRMCGHLAVFKNNRRMRQLYKAIPRWRSLLEAPEHLAIDEGEFSKVFRPRKRHFIKRLLAPKTLFTYRYSTPGGTRLWPDGQLAPSNWTWQDGRLRHERGGENSVYLHMMFWQSDRWLDPKLRPAPWSRLPNIVQCDWREAATRGFTISPQGIRLLA